MKWIFHVEDMDEDEINDDVVMGEGSTTLEGTHFENQADQELLEDLIVNMSDSERDDTDSGDEDNALDVEDWSSIFEKAESLVYP